MHYFDPARPRLPSGTLQYISESGAPIGALTGLQIAPGEAGGWDISVMLCIAHNTARWHYAHCADIDDLHGLLAWFTSDPEHCFRKRFGHTYDSTPRPAPLAKAAAGKPTLSLDDLE